MVKWHTLLSELLVNGMVNVCVSFCVFVLCSASLSLDEGEDGVRQVAKTLQACLELKEPVQQIQLVKKVGMEQKIYK